MPPAYRRCPPAVSLPFASLVASTSRLPLPSPSPVASSSHLCLFSSLLRLAPCVLLAVPVSSLPPLLHTQQNRFVLITRLSRLLARMDKDFCSIPVDY
ncbi:hypothetical protein B0H14DRAFT_3514947 [Mycena olivaceomarginata]|nr:hypothetical protein B0H14DRAFT_3514947 [Mycena olivaceomarginata]